MESNDSEADCETVGAQEYAALLSAVFGDSDTDEDFSDNNCIEDEVDFESNGVYLWQKVEEVEGLWHCSHFLSLKQQQSLLHDINSEGWFSDPRHNQAMRFGDLPGWAMDLSALIRSRIVGHQSGEGLAIHKSDHYSRTDGLHDLRDSTILFPPGILEREPLFDQMIVNLYHPGEGISAHVDLLRFDDGIAIVSLESACVMSFRIVVNPSHKVENICLREPISYPHDDDDDDDDDDFSPVIKDRSHSGLLYCKQVEASGMISQAKDYKSRSRICERDPTSGVVKKVDVLLNPGDLVITHGPARYNWTHEITRDKDHQVWQGQPIEQQRRVSVTLRRLCFQKDVQ